MPQPDVSGGLAKLHAAMRPGGWVVVGTIAPAGSTRGAAAGRLLVDLWGGIAVANAEMEALLTVIGFTNVRTLPGPPNGGLIVAQRA